MTAETSVMWRDPTRTELVVAGFEDWKKPRNANDL